MLARLCSATVVGIQAVPVTIEVDVSPGLPIFTMVGRLDTSLRESRDRVRSAVKNSGFTFPDQRVTVNLAPADVPKAGASFDLAIALGVIAATGAIERREVDELAIFGELSLDGRVQPARGILAVAIAARRHRLDSLMLPEANVCEAAVVEGLRLCPVSTLQEAARLLDVPSSKRGLLLSPPTRPGDPSRPAENLADVRGQALARRALEIAAAGGHNLLFVGPPGSGKTMMARRLPGILPELSFEEALECSVIHSVAGLIPSGAGLLPMRPFRAPHHTVSSVALAGGGRLPRPGEISLAHRGVLFLDELLEFGRATLEVLRQPLEEGRVTITRAAGTVTFPARFMLVAATNPCPCGFHGDPARPCRCTPLQIAQYHARLSGPLLDRIDLTVEVPALPFRELTVPAGGEDSRTVRSRVMAARQVQAKRGSPTCAGVNAELTGRALQRCCRLDGQGTRLFERLAHRLPLTARGFERLLRVARTIADLERAPAVGPAHIAEAAQYRAESSPYRSSKSP